MTCILRNVYLFITDNTFSNETDDVTFTFIHTIMHYSDKSLTMLQCVGEASQHMATAERTVGVDYM